MEQLNIEGKRSGEGFICHRERLVNALSRAQAPKARINDIELGRKGFLNYLRALGGSNVIKITPSGSASEAQAAEKSLRIVCGSNTGCLPDNAWVSDKDVSGATCEIRVSPNASVVPNIGAIELAQALSMIIPFAAGKAEQRPVLSCVRFAQGGGKLTLTATDAYRLAEINLDFEDGEAAALIPAEELKGLVSALKKAHRVRLSIEPSGNEHNDVFIETEAIRYKFPGEIGTYPDYKQIIPVEFEASARFDTREMLKAGASLSALSLDRTSAIALSLREGKLTLSAADERGSAQVDAEVEGEAVSAINGAYLTQALRALGGMAEVKLSKSKTPIVFAVDGYRLAIMPVVMPTKPKVHIEAEAEAIAREAEAKAEREAKVKAHAEKPRKKHHKAKVPVAA